MHLKKGTKAYEKKLDEMRKLLSHMFKVLKEEPSKLHEDVSALYNRLNSDCNAEALFFDCEGQRQIESMMFLPGVSSGALSLCLALYSSIMRLPMYLSLIHI